MLQFEREQRAEKEVRTEQSAGRVLVVDDNANLLDVLSEVLVSNGFEVLAANSASEALDILSHTRPEIIVSDVMMPAMNGFELRDYIDKNPAWSSIPFIYLTALSDASEVRQAQQKGCDDYLLKPFDPQDLVSVLRGKIALARHRERINEVRLESYRKRVIHTLSHEFRTPLVAINTGTELLLDQGESLGDERVRDLLESIQRGGQRLHRMIDDFMTLQQIDSGTALSACKRYKKRSPAAAILESAVDRFNDSNGPEPAAVEIILNESERAAVEVYDIQIIDALVRLLHNAAKFGAAHGPISASLVISEGEVHFLVRDRGPGMRPETYPQVCDVFTQIDRERFEQQGCGIGLAVVSYYTKINGGRLAFGSPRFGPGLEVTVSFPKLGEPGSDNQHKS